MSVTAALGAATPLLGGLFDLIDNLFTTEEEREAAKLKVLELQAKGDLAQLGVNMQEAQHKSLFVAGWRPFIGWVCGLAFTWAFLIAPMFKAVVSYIAQVNGVPVDFSGIPEPDLNVMMPVLMGMLGLGAMRSFEKREGVAANNMRDGK